MNHSEVAQPIVLLTGATGYIGGRLLRVLEQDGLRVRCFVRDPERLRERVGEGTEVVRGDVMSQPDLSAAMAGVTDAYYLIHSMAATSDFASRDRTAASNFSAAAKAAGVRRIIYLGGLGSGDHLSLHLQSRQEVGRILRESGVPTMELRASVVIGSGSLSFEMIRALVERLPVMITPRWVRIKTQPIAIEDVISYLRRALDLPLEQSDVFEIGGRDRVTYEELMQEYARQRGLHRWMFRVPVLTPRLSSLWLGLVTPIYARVGRTLIDSLPHETVVRDERAREVFGIQPLGVKEAVERALRNEDADYAATRWSDALSSKKDGGRVHFAYGSRRLDSRAATLHCSPAEAFAPIESLGGSEGWFRSDWLWRLRGLLDLMVGGPGMRRGRRHPHELMVGDTLDFWRVEAVDPPRLLRLAAEMKLPGRAWLQYEIDPLPDGGCIVRQTAMYDPVGVFGLAYWYMLWPIHSWVFADLLRGIRLSAEANRRR
jgi:uncharacterized protein YbjT (DUF2867 family)